MKQIRKLQILSRSSIQSEQFVKKFNNFMQALKIFYGSEHSNIVQFIIP